MTQRGRAEVRVGPHGRVVIPTELQRALRLEEGELLVGRVENDSLILERRSTILHRLQERVADIVPPNMSIADELIADRRVQARRENDIV